MYLYRRGRANLTLKEKNYFKLPVEQRIKRGTDSLQLWIKIVESIFQKRGMARQVTMDDWLESSKSVDCDLTQPKVRKKFNAQGNLSKNYSDGGEEVS